MGTMMFAFKIACILMASSMPLVNGQHGLRVKNQNGRELQGYEGLCAVELNAVQMVAEAQKPIKSQEKQLNEQEELVNEEYKDCLYHDLYHDKTDVTIVEGNITNYSSCVQTMIAKCESI